MIHRQKSKEELVSRRFLGMFFIQRQVEQERLGSFFKYTFSV